MTEQEEREIVKSVEAANSAFRDWLAYPMTRMGISMIPAGEQRDALEMLLRAAFDTGVKHGQGQLVMSVIERMIKNKRDRS